MRKIWIFVIAIIIILVGVVAGVLIYNKDKMVKDNTNNLVINEVNEISEKVTDECTDEYKKEIETTSQDEKISPNCLMILKKYYKECNHTINEYVDIPQDLVNKTEENLKNEYPYWNIEKFSSNEIILYKEFDSNCGQHFVLKSNGGKISVYKINEDSTEEVYENTEISTEYLSDTDKTKLKVGIAVNGIENLNKVLEDFE